MKQTKRKREVAAVPTAEPGSESGAAQTPAAGVAPTDATPVTHVAPPAEEHHMSNSSEATGVHTESSKSTSATAANTPFMYALSANCTVRDGVGLRSALLDLLASQQTVTIDIRGVERIDTAALQVLCAFVRDRKAAGGAVNWLGSADSFCEAVRLLGLKQALGISDELLQGAAS